MITRLLTPMLLLVVTSFCLAEEVAPPPEAKPYIGTWAAKQNPRDAFPAPRLKIHKDGTGAYFLGDPDKPLYEFTWKMGEDQLQAAVTDGERFCAGILRPDGKMVWRQVKLPPGVTTNGIEFEKVPSDF